MTLVRADHWQVYADGPWNFRCRGLAERLAANWLFAGRPYLPVIADHDMTGEWGPVPVGPDGQTMHAPTDPTKLLGVIHALRWEAESLFVDAVLAEPVAAHLRAGWFKGWSIGPRGGNRTLPDGRVVRFDELVELSLLREPGAVTGLPVPTLTRLDGTPY